MLSNAEEMVSSNVFDWRTTKNRGPFKFKKILLYISNPNYGTVNMVIEIVGLFN